MINKDWVIQPQWDDSKVQKGYKALDAKMEKLARKQESLYKKEISIIRAKNHTHKEPYIFRTNR